MGQIRAARVCYTKFPALTAPTHPTQDSLATLAFLLHHKS